MTSVEVYLHFKVQVLTFQWHFLWVSCSSECPWLHLCPFSMAQLIGHLCLSTARMEFKVERRADRQIQRKTSAARDSGRGSAPGLPVRPLVGPPMLHFWPPQPAELCWHSESYWLLTYHMPTAIHTTSIRGFRVMEEDKRERT